MVDTTLDNRRLWWRWVGANAIGEMLGLGATFALTAFFFLRLGGDGSAGSVLLTFGFAVASGVLEATVVGLAQWWAMHPWLPTIRRVTWWLATLAGALVAYVLGYLPSTLMDLGADAGSQAPMTEPPQWVILLLAAGLGLVGGAVLSFAQWLVLRKAVDGAGWWIPANMLAWAAGMPIIFWGMDAAQKGQPLWQTILILAVTLLVAGAMVGAVHGAVLVELVDRKRPALAPA
jgi:hypothetical protein